MSDFEKYSNKVQRAVTLFLHCGDDYLFVKRNKSKRIDPGRLNGIGGRLESGENFLEAAIRETKEESGYIVTTKDIKLAGVVTLQGGYEVDWMMCFFKIQVPTKKLNLNPKTEDGELIWLPKDDVLGADFELVDDINYCFDEIVAGKGVFFLTAKLNDDQLVYESSKSVLD
jgi:8-oxo-dGTP pyrophosphatase MutT (NUDIX family)